VFLLLFKKKLLSIIHRIVKSPRMTATTPSCHSHHHHHDVVLDDDDLSTSTVFLSAVFYPITIQLMAIIYYLV
jgi:hypothetical protein